ncbi:cytochrome b/b6 domain-containing protein [Pararhizobium arenae]|uniref:cytochrome b/b6 domain-containing protein n=1 Tax=Pararhizobium arenae TaxID=1856850 RepID=UPI00094B2053|nr:cytochrome b/b6 domain-containing protein [Pararhizobium arenae]
MSRMSHRGEGAISSPGRRGFIRVWDPIVRLFHWTVVTACILNLFILEEGRYWHRVTGYGVAGVLILRFVWGVIGTRYARFSEFFPTPRKLFRQITDIRQGHHPRFIGHNPLASVMMLTLMLLLAATCTTGWMTTLDAFWGEKWLEEIHGLLANGIMVFAFIHAGAALLESYRQRENLVWSMVTGRKWL